MLSLGKFITWPQWNPAIFQKPVSKSVIILAKTHQIQVSFSPNRLVQLGLLGVLGQPRIGLCVHASNSQGQGGNNVLEMDNFDEADDFLEEEEEEEEDFAEDDEDEDAEFIPLKNMKKWLENKPRGFGEDKAYDTSIEDKLMEEIEQSRRAQLANINNLKNNPVRSDSEKQLGQQEKGNCAVSEDCKHGFRVRLVNLPKKKNIHRDLQSAFKGVPGIVDIVPVVSGNKRTKDPICKGLAFIDFKSENEAFRFVQTFSGQSITFGKVQKQIKCDMNSSLLKPGTEHRETNYTAQTAMPSLDFQAEKISANFESENEVNESMPFLDNEESLGDNQSPPLPESICKDGPEERGELAKREIGKVKKGASKMKKKRVSKIHVPGSANRLKIKEKALLAGVFSKYAANTSTMTESRAD